MIATMPPVARLVVVESEGGTTPRAAEFFAGIGLVRLGLEAAGFDVVWSNDIEPAKRDMYVGNFRESDPAHRFVLGDIAKVSGSDMPASLALAWASFPCIDLSLAGWRRGLDGSHSATFWHFTRILDEMGDARPAVVVLENVVGFATSRGGSDLAAAIREINKLGYSADVLTLDARRFVPQSRPRLFIVGAKQVPTDQPTDDTVLRPAWLQAPFLDPSLVTHRAGLPEPPPLLATGLAEIVEQLSEDNPQWWDAERTRAFVSSLSPVQLERLSRLQSADALSYRTAYRRTREGRAVWEIRPDDISGCLRTARGGSSKQALVQAGHGAVRVRWMTPREYARLMGAEDYRLDKLRRNQALFGFGDAVCVPVVEWLAEHYLMPLVRGELSDPPALSLAVAAGA
jgi:DNA (cytosine-5)-methyltransferase 1